MSNKIALRSGFFITKSFLTIICIFSVGILAVSSLIVSYFASQNAFNLILYCQIITPDSLTSNTTSEDSEKSSLIKINDIQYEPAVFTDQLSSIRPFGFSLNIKTDNFSREYEGRLMIKLQNLKQNNRQISFKIPTKIPTTYKSAVFTNSRRLKVKSEIIDDATGNYVINLVETLSEDSHLIVDVKFMRAITAAIGQNIFIEYGPLRR